MLLFCEEPELQAYLLQERRQKRMNFIFSIIFLVNMD